MKPLVNALLLADHVHVDHATGKITILGTFDRIHVREFPGVHHGPWLYANLSDFTGTHTFAMRFVRDSDGQQLAVSKPIEIKHGRDKLRHREIALKLPPLQFAHPGTYALQILWDGDWIGELKMRAEKLKKG